MSELTSEAIFAELAKLRDSKNRVISFADGQTIVPNSLLEEVWREAERSTEARIIKLLEEQTGCGYEHYETERCFCDAIALIKGEQK